MALTVSTGALYQTAKKALVTAGAIVRKGYDQSLQIKFKSPTSPVTQIDLAAEKVILKTIRKQYPDHDFIAEESPSMHKSALEKFGGEGYRWIIDPLDGTVNFTHRVPIVNVSIAVEHKGVILAGGVYDPFRDELFMAQKGKGATMNGRRISVSRETRLPRALLATGFPYDHRERATFYLSYVEDFLKVCMDVRRLGAAAIDLAWVACGRFDSYWEFRLNPWDVAAGALLVKEAGGNVLNFKGGPLAVYKPEETLATNGRLDKALLKVMANVKTRRIS